jgi:hypothetical protein
VRAPASAEADADPSLREVEEFAPVRVVVVASVGADRGGAVAAAN